MQPTQPASTQGQIFKAIPAIMQEMSAIEKGHRNNSQNWNFRGIDDMYNELHGLLAKHKVFTVPRVLSQSREERQTKSGGVMVYSILNIEFSFYAEDGSFVTALVTGEGSDTGDKASNKAMSVAHKYAFLQVFAIPTKELDKDPDFESHEFLPKPNPVNANKAKALDQAIKDIEKQGLPPVKAGMATLGQTKMVWARLKNELKLNDLVAREYIKTQTSKENSRDLTAADVKRLLDQIDHDVKALKEPVGVDMPDFDQADLGSIPRKS